MVVFFKDQSMSELNNENVKEAQKWLQSHRILQYVTIEKENSPNDKIKIKFNSKATLASYHKGSICGCIPIPGKYINKIGDEPHIVKTPEIVVKSPNVIKALKNLSQVWQDRFAKSVLISAPPGSGKEQFAGSIPYGTGRINETSDMISISLASGIQGDLERLLYGTQDEHGNRRDGLIEKAKNSVLFLDEVHHPDKRAGIRASLLRPLESEEYIPCGDTEPKKVENVLFVLATSKPLKSIEKVRGLADIPPRDFWTRMTHVIKIKHPFEGIYGSSLTDIINGFFRFFWWDRLEKFFKIDPETEIDQVANNLSYGLRLSQMQKLKDENLKELADRFCERLFFILSTERVQPHELSIRGFRNIVTRLFSICVAKVTEGDKWEPEELEREMDPVIYEILEIAKLDSPTA